MKLERKLLLSALAVAFAVSSFLVVKTMSRVRSGTNDKPVIPIVSKDVAIVPEGPPAPAKSDATAPAPKRIPISSYFAEGLIMKKVAPIYPHEARVAHIWGTVVLQAVIGTDGHVYDLKVISGPEVLRQAAIDAVKQRKYRPYLLKYVPVEASTTIKVIFNNQTVDLTANPQ